MKTLQLLSLLTIISLATGCKKEPAAPSVEQHEQGTLPKVESDTIPKDSMGAATQSE